MKLIPLYCYLKMLRNTAGYSKQEVATWLDISPSAYAHYETGRYASVNNQYLTILEKNYKLTYGVLSRLPKVDVSRFSFDHPLSAAENLAAFLLFHNDPANSEKYKHLTYNERWCIYYYSMCNNKEALLNMLFAAPLLLPMFMD